MRPSGLNATLLTTLRSASVAVFCPVATFHKLMPVKSPAASVRPSGLNAMLLITLWSASVSPGFFCPVVATFHKLMPPSLSPTARVRPSGLNATLLTQ